MYEYFNIAYCLLYAVIYLRSKTMLYSYDTVRIIVCRNHQIESCILPALACVSRSLYQQMSPFMRRRIIYNFEDDNTLA